MPEADVLAAFPRRRLAVRAGWRSTLGSLAAAAMALACVSGAAFFAWSYGRDLLQEARIWDTGRPVPALGWKWRCRTQLVLADCNVDVSYEASPGRTVTLPASALVMFSMDDNPPPLQVKVDPEHPDRFAASVLVDERPSRWMALAVLSGGLLLLGGIVGGGAWALLHQRRLWRSLALQPRPVAAEVVGTRLVSNPGWAREYSFRYELDGLVRTGRQRLRVLKGSHGVPPEGWRYEEPVPLDPGGTRLLALAGPDGALLVPSSFAPLVLTDAEKARVTAAQAAAAARS